MRINARLSWLVIMLVAAVACAPRPKAGPQADPRVTEQAQATGEATGEATGPGTGQAALAGKTCYLTQLHLHGQSNHNGNALPASMESQTYEAKRNGFDVIWWTDHAELFEDFEDLRINLASATIDSAGNISLIARMGRQLAGFAVSKSPGAEVAIEDHAIRASAKGQPGSGEFGRAALKPVSKIGTVRSIQFCRPVTSGLKLESDLGVVGLGPDTYLRFTFDFSWHPAGRHRAIFEAVTGVPAKPSVVGDTTVVWQFAFPEAGPLVFDLLKAVAPLPAGDDDVLSSFTIEIGARDGAQIAIKLGSLALRSEEPLGITQYATVKSLAERYAARFGVTSYVGAEVGKIHTSAAPHMNAYPPKRAETLDGLALGLIATRRAWIEEIHREYGLVSVNHPFGASRNPRSRRGEPEDYEDMPSAEPPRVLAVRGPSATENEFRDVARPLIDGKAFGADMLEVGYLYRGTGSLDDHLRLWDLTLANGVRLVGTGTSDSHGGVWGPDMLPNPFASWIWSAGTGAGELIDALSRGHVAFGDPFNWKADFAFLASASGGSRAVMMGDTLSLPAGTPVEARVYINPGRDDLEVVAVQTKMQRSDDLVQTRQTLGGSADYKFSVAVEESCFVRIEVRGRDGTPLVFSNPIYLFPIASENR